MQKTKNNKIRKLIFLSLFVIMILATVLNFYIHKLPKEISIIEGKEQKIDFKMPFSFELFCKEPFYVNGSHITDSLKINLKEPLILQAQKIGTYDLEFRWFGVIPVKKLKVHVLPEIKLVPGGHSLGVKLRPNGVIVVGFATVVDEKGRKTNPSQDAGLQIGDTIISVNNQKIYHAEELTEIVNRDKKVTLLVKRNNDKFKLDFEAVKSKSGTYQMGLWVRDIAAGVGTLTFYDSETSYYGALGHIISDQDTGKIIEVGDGQIVRSRITDILPGRKNQPGEKKGVFVNEQQVMGNILANTPYGIFGKAYQKFENPLYNPIPVATMSQVREGPAKILTVVEGEEINEYDIEIQKIMRQSYPTGKGMVVKITDQELIKKTGGIVQGMSGSPIIQDGHIVGAITHVFVNDPTKGYGVFIEWMLNEIKNINSKQI